MDHAEDTTGNHIETKHSESFRWRAWPCESCGGGSTPIDFLVRRIGSSPETPNGDRNQVIDWFKKWEAVRLLEWIQGCGHTQWLDTGSEHLVPLDEQTGEVVKDARSDNFVLAREGMVPIDIRVWDVPIPADGS